MGNVHGDWRDRGLRWPFFWNGQPCWTGKFGATIQPRGEDRSCPMAFVDMREFS